MIRLVEDDNVYVVVSSDQLNEILKHLVMKKKHQKKF